MADFINVRKEFFFDRLELAIDDGARRALSMFGAYVRKDSRSSLRRRKKPSKPGTPPSVHTSDAYATLKNILFFYEPQSRSVVIGPVKLKAKKEAGQTTLSATVPQINEEGGTLTITKKTPVRIKSGRKASPAQLAAFKAQLAAGQATPPSVFKVIQKVQKYDKRPFMVPAFQRTLPAVPSMWRDTVKA